MAWVTFLSLGRHTWQDAVFYHIFRAITRKAAHRHVATPADAKITLAHNPTLVVITDASLTLPQYASVWDDVLEYVRRGGRAIITCRFSRDAAADNIPPFFAKAGLPWEYGGFFHATVNRNTANVPQSSLPFAPANCRQMGLFLKGVDPSLAWYSPSTYSLITSPGLVGTTSVAMAPVGEGQLGYFGDALVHHEALEIALGMTGLYDRDIDRIIFRMMHSNCTA